MPNDNPTDDINQPQNNGADFIESFMKKSPEVQQHAVDAERNKASVVETPIKNESAPEKFNSEIHVVGKDGKPSVTKTGKFRKKKNIVNPFDKTPQQVEIDANIVDSQASAELVQSLKRVAYDGLFEYKYDDTRHKIHVEATTKYFVSSGGVKLTPLQGLMILEGFMALELMRTEKATTKITGFKAWCASKWVKISDKRKNRKNAQSSNRADNEREIEIKPEDVEGEMRAL